MAVGVLAGGEVVEGALAAVPTEPGSAPTAIIPCTAQAVDCELTAPSPPSGKPPLARWCLRR